MFPSSHLAAEPVSQLNCAERMPLILIPSASFLRCGFLINILGPRLPFSFVVVQSLSCGGLFATPWTAAGQALLSSTISQRLLKLMSIESVMPFDHLILCHPLFLLTSIFPASGSFLMSWLFTSGGALASASVLPMSIQS